MCTHKYIGRTNSHNDNQSGSLLVDACLCVQVQAVSEWGAKLTGVGTYGEWANVSVYPDFPEELPASGGVCVCVCVMCVCVCVRVHACVFDVYMCGK